MTYSINIGQNKEATSFIPMEDYLDDLLLRLKDNTTKLINPIDLRDSILSLYGNIPFKLLSTSNNKYIGLDTGEPNGGDIKMPIYIGKRAFENLNVMVDDLLTSDTDIFLYNTKSDLIEQDETKVVLLAGSDFTKHKDSPYILTQRATGLTDSNVISFMNTKGNINITSLDSSESPGFTSSVFINNIKFPTPDESNGVSDNDVLFSNNGELYWDQISFPSGVSTIGATGSEFNIYGSDVTINGYGLEFEDNRKCPIEIGDIKYGDTFNNLAISDMLRRMIYDYSPPTSSIRILGEYSDGYAEVGSSFDLFLEWTLNKKTENTKQSALENMSNPNSYPPIISDSYETVVGTSRGAVGVPLQKETTIFKVKMEDITDNQSESSVSITGVLPYFVGYSDQVNMSSTELGNLTKIIEGKSDKTYDIVGSGNLYFVYDKSYGTLSNIYDQNGTDVTSNFTYSQQQFYSPDGLNWVDDFYVYVWVGAPTNLPVSVNYEFVY
jgi:hypothetical protein